MEATGGIVNTMKYKSDAVAIIQARMNSKRLPGKSLMDLAGKPLLAHVIERAKLIHGVKDVVVATSINKSDDPLVDLALSMDIKVFRGSEDNVLERYYKAYQKYNGSYIVRITGDNPFIDVDYGSMAIEIAAESGADLISISGLPLGTAVEIIKDEALQSAYEMSDNKYHFEHVTPYIKEHTELFSIERHEVDIKNPFQDLRLTVDTIEDFTLAKKIYENLYKGEPFPLEDVISFLKENPQLTTINKDIKQRPMFHSENE